MVRVASSCGGVHAPAQGVAVVPLQAGWRASGRDCRSGLSAASIASTAWLVTTDLTTCASVASGARAGVDLSGEARDKPPIHPAA